MIRFTSALLRTAGCLCSAADQKLIVDPLVADWQREYREASGRGIFRAAVVIVRGLLAFATTLIICANPFRGVEGVPARRFALAILGFALAAMLIQSAPFQTLNFYWTVFRTDVYLNYPRFFAIGIALAMLPAGILVADGLRRSRFIIVIGLALVTAFIFSDVVAPWTERIQQERRGLEFWSRFLPPEQVQARLQHRAQTEEEWRRRPDVTGARAKGEYLERHRDAAFTVLAIAFGLLGRAIGTSRVSAGSSRRVPVAALWWFFVWMAYQLLRFWSGRLAQVLPAPAEVAIWLPPLVFLAIAMAASLETKAGDKAPPLPT